jgi:hypothetical protein
MLYKSILSINTLHAAGYIYIYFLICAESKNRVIIKTSIYNLIEKKKHAVLLIYI